MVERVNDKLILMNLRMIYFEDLPTIMKRWMPEVKQVRTYCRVWCYDNKIPPNDAPSEWKGIECLSRDMTLEQLSSAREVAISESNPEIPTICLVEIPLKYSETIEEAKNERSITQWWKDTQTQAASSAITKTSYMEEVD
jgi:hypothetical protein